MIREKRVTVVTITYRLLGDAQRGCDAASYWSGIRRCRCHAAGSSEFPSPNRSKCLSDSPDRCWGAGLAETVYYCRRCCRPNPTARNATPTAAALRNKVCEPHGIADRTSTYNWPQLANWRIKRNKNMIDLVLFFNSRSSLVLPDVTVPHPRYLFQVEQNNSIFRYRQEYGIWT